MQITTRHGASSYGVPVITDDRGCLLDYGPGIQAVMTELGWDRHQLAERCGLTERTVRGWLYEGRMPEVRALNVLADALADAAKKPR